MKDASFFEIDFRHAVPALRLVHADCSLMALDLRSDCRAYCCGFNFADLEFPANRKSAGFVVVYVFCHFVSLYALGCVRLLERRLARRRSQHLYYSVFVYAVNYYL